MKPLKEVLSKPMSRQEFLTLTGVAILGLFGVSNFLTYFLRHNNQQQQQPAQVAKNDASHGFGSRTFGS